MMDDRERIKYSLLTLDENMLLLIGLVAIVGGVVVLQYLAELVSLWLYGR